MATLNDLLKVVSLVLLLGISVHPFTIQLLQYLIQTRKYDQWYILQTLVERDVNVFFLADADIAHTVAVPLAIVIALYINSFVQITLYHIHLLLYEPKPAQVALIVLENLWNFFYCTLSPIVAMQITHVLATQFLNRYCTSSYTSIIADVLAVYMLLVVFGITDLYALYRTYEIELMAVPLNLSPQEKKSLSI